jgi:hypothetical protein
VHAALGAFFFACAISLAGGISGSVSHAQEAPASPSPSPGTPAPSITPAQPGQSPQGEQSPQPEQSPTLAPIVVPPSPVPVVLEQQSAYLILGRSVSIHVQSPPSGIVILSGFDPAIVRAIFNPIDHTIDLTGLRTGATTVTASMALRLRCR